MRFMIKLAVIAAVSALPAAAQASEMTAPARKILSSRLLDPDSLQLRNLRDVIGEANGSQGPFLCGEYNAKNRMGGYSGYKTFVYDPRIATLITSDASFYSDKYGDFDLDDFMEQEMTPDNMSSYIKTVNMKMAEYEAYLSVCA